MFRLTNDADCDELAQAVIKLAALPEKTGDVAKCAAHREELAELEGTNRLEFNEILKLESLMAREKIFCLLDFRVVEQKK